MDDRCAELEEAVKPSINFLNRYYDLHTTIVINQGYVKIVRDEVGIPIKID